MCRTPHPHANVIKAWADGYEVEEFVENGYSGLWIPCISPSFDPDCGYRVSEAYEYLFIYIESTSEELKVSSSYYPTERDFRKDNQKSISYVLRIENSKRKVKS